MIVKIFEDYTEGIKEIKNTIFLKAVETWNIDIIDSFVKRGYDINGDDDIIETFSEDVDLFEYFIKNNGDVNEGMKNYSFKANMENLEIQKVLIDNGYDKLIYDTVGFHSKFKNDPNLSKYADIIKMHEDIDKFNL